MNDLPDLDDDLRSTLNGTADALDLELAPAGELAQRGARRRRRKRALGGVAATALVAVVAVGVVGTRGDDSTVATADVAAATTEPELLPPADDATSDATTDDTIDGATDAAPAITTPPTMPPVDAEAPATAAVTAFGPSGDALVAPWRDGFIRVARTFPAQPLPNELPDELRALFPQEILDLFPDGLPPTIDEATRVLSDAGLLDVVTELISEHPELGEALYAADPLPVELQIATTSDGLDWVPVSLDLPAEIADPTDVRVSDDRLLAWSIVPETDGQFATVSISDDLTTWRTTTFDIPTDATSDPAIHREAWVQQIAPVGDGWVAMVSRSSWIEWEALLPDDVRREVDASDGWGTSVDDAGIEIQIGDGEPLQYTWDELGLDGNPELDDEPTLEFVVADAAGNVSRHTAPDNSWGELTTWNGQVVLVGQTVSVSSDGANWTELAILPEGAWASGAAPVGDQLVVTGGDDVGDPAGWLIASDGTVTEVELPDLPGQYSLWGGRDSAAWIVELYDETLAPSEPTEPATVTFDYDGLVVTLDESPTGSSVVAVDAATGAIVAERTYSPDDAENENVYQYDEATDTSWLVITDESTGDELLRIPGDVVADAVSEAYGADESIVDEPAVEAPAEEWNPDYWLVATTDGGDWYTADVADPGPWLNQSAAVNGTALIFPDGDTWQRIDLGG